MVPRSKLPKILREIGEIGGRYGLIIANVFHAGDGNIHPLICFDLTTPGDLDRAIAAGSEIMKRCIEAGGSVSGEHGIGHEKRDYLPLMYSPADLAAMLRVRAVFDPAGLCNPGKIFPADRPEGHGDRNLQSPAMTAVSDR